MGHPDADPKLIGRNIHVMLTPLPPNKRKPKFHVREEGEQPGEHDNDPDSGEESGSNSDSNPTAAGA
jgi:translation initiation factor IF-3